MGKMTAAVFMAALTFAVCGCTERPSEKKPDTGTLRRDILDTLDLMTEYSTSGRYGDLLETVLPLYNEAVRMGNDTGQIVFGSGVAEAYSRLDMPDSAIAYLHRIHPIAEKMNNRSMLSMIYNTRGLYSLYYRMNYNEAVECFLKALYYTDTTGSSGTDSYYRTMSNIAHTYNLRRDTSGLKYSMKTYLEGKRTGNDYLVYIGAINTATQYCIRRDYQHALAYIDEAMEFADKYHNTVEVYYLYADIMAGTGKVHEAETYYRKALEASDDVETAVLCGIYRSYGDFLMSRGRWSDAAGIYRSGIDAARKVGSYMYLYALYLGLSEAYGEMGDTESELRYYKQFHYLSDSVFNYEKERTMNEMLVKYETEKKERLLQQQEVQLLHKNRKLTAYAFIIALLTVVVVAVLILYVKRREMYRQLVKRHYENYILERRLMGREEHTAGKDSNPNTGNDRLSQLFKEISTLMEKEKVYRNSGLTVESLAKLLNTNRTYVSSAIKQSCGMTFKDYVNSLRVAEAVSMLSDPENDIPLKAMFSQLGFNSTSTFYRVFQNATGVPPSRYRKESRRIAG